MERTMAGVGKGLPSGWADQACRVADHALSMWRDASEVPAAAMTAAAAHNARWLASTQVDPSASTALANGSRLAQVAAEALVYVGLVQCEAEKAGLAGEAWSTAGAGEGAVVAAEAGARFWALRAAQASVAAQELARAANTDQPHLEGALADALRQMQRHLFASAAPAVDALSALREAPWAPPPAPHPHSPSFSSTFSPLSSSPPPPPPMCARPSHHRLLLRRHRSTPTLLMSPSAEPMARPGAGSGTKVWRANGRSPPKRPSFMGKVCAAITRFSKVRTMAVAAATIFGLLLLLAKSPGVSPIASWGHSQLALDMGAFQELILVPKVRSVLLRVMRSDPDLNNALHYMGTARFRKRCLILEGMPEVEKLSQMLAADGVGLRTTLRSFSEQLELVYSRVKARKKKKKTKQGEEGEEETPRGSLRPFMQELKAAIPAKQIQGLYQAKMQDSEPFQRFITYVKGTEAKVIVKKIKSFKEYTTVVDTLKSREIEIEDLIDYVRWLFTGIKTNKSS